MRRSDGRLIERIPLPVDLFEEAERRAAIAGIDVATYLGDLIAAELPLAMAEATAERLERGRRSLSRTCPPVESVSPPVLAPRGPS